ncbi:substrate-binding domain-containing protein [bacterium]|nr:substrate-binding domain-containing protein [bacterium]
MRKLFSLSYTVLLSWMLLYGCSGSGDGNKQVAIAVIPMGTTHEFWKSIHAGAVTASQELGVNIIWKGPLKEDDRDEQIQIVETFIAAHISAIVLSPLDDRALVLPVREAKKLGIPTVVFNSALQGDDHIAFVSTENYQGGVIGANRIGALLGGKGNVILVRVHEGSEGSTKREEGFLATIRSSFPGITMLSDNQYAGVTTETAYRTCENLLNRFNDVDAMFTPNESTTFGCLRALQDRGLAGRIILVGFDSSEKLIEALEKREIQGLVLQNPFNMGYLSVKTAVASLKGEQYEKRIDTGVTLATPENMNDPEINRLLRPDLSILNGK